MAVLYNSILDYLKLFLLTVKKIMKKMDDDYVT